jgi:hypothetical protein
MTQASGSMADPEDVPEPEGSDWGSGRIAKSSVKGDEQRIMGDM